MRIYSPIQGYTPCTAFADAYPAGVAEEKKVRSRYFFLPTPPSLPFFATTFLVAGSLFRLPLLDECFMVTGPKKLSSLPAKNKTKGGKCDNTSMLY